jgi:hypothetical protein
MGASTQIRGHTHDRHAAAQPHHKKNDYQSVKFHHRSLVVIVITTFIIAGFKVMFQ